MHLIGSLVEYHVRIIGIEMVKLRAGMYDA